MSLQQIFLSRDARELLRWIEEYDPCEMNKAVFEASVTAQELKNKILADHEGGALRLIKNCKI